MRDAAMSARVVVARACLAVFVVGLVAFLVTLLAGGSSSSQQLITVAFVAYAAVGYLLAVRRPDNPIGWLLLGGVAIGGVFLICQSLADWLTRTRLDSELLRFLAYWPTNWLWLPLVSLTTTLPVLLFPTGRLLSPRWRPVAWLTVAATVLYAVANAFAADIGSEVDGTLAPNPISPPFMRQLGDPADWTLNNALLLVLALTLVIALVSVVVRWRRAVAVERLQLRWLLLGAVGLAAGFVLNFVVPPPLGNLLLTLGFTALPVCLGIAVLRYRLYDIDRVVSRTVTYTLVTGIALAVYAVVVTSATALLPDTSSSFAVALATLAAAALVRPVLRRVQHGVDHRFNRSRYDAEHTVEQFAASLRGQVDVGDVTASLLAVVTSTMGTSSHAMWLVDDRGRRGR